MRKDKANLPASELNGDVDGFLRQLASTPSVGRGEGQGRLIFSMDATASREATWDKACHIQSEMFLATEALGGLSVQLAFYRGFGECKSSPWVNSSAALVQKMAAVMCLGGRTQIRKILKHTLRQNEKKRVNALIFVGDCIEEDIDELCELAGKLGVRGVPIFVFQEGNDQAATMGFRQFARLTGGAHCHFDINSAEELKSLLAAVAVFASGGRKALENFGGQNRQAVARLTSQVK